MKWLRRNAFWAAPILVLILFIPWSAELDMQVATWSFNTYWGVHHDVRPDSFLHSFFDLIYNYGCVPAQIICGGAVIILIISWKYRMLLALRGPCLVLVLSLVIGSGIIAHSILKEWWGRPRPKQLVVFGGSQGFKPFYVPATMPPPEPSKSFPSGHSTTGFYLFALYFIGRRIHDKSLKLLGLISGIALGLVLSVTRVVQGGHFVSDVLVAALIMWLSAYVSDLLVYRYQSFWDGYSTQLICKNIVAPHADKKTT